MTAPHPQSQAGTERDAPQKCGMWCYDCKEEIDVDLIDGDATRAHEELENKGKALGWGMGLMASGQAYYSCPCCAPCLYNFRVFHGYPNRTPSDARL